MDSSLMQSAYSRSSRDHHLWENAYNRRWCAALLMTDLVETHVAPYFNALYQLERDGKRRWNSLHNYFHVQYICVLAYYEQLVLTGTATDPLPSFTFKHCEDSSFHCILNSHEIQNSCVWHWTPYINKQPGGRRKCCLSSQIIHYQKM